MIGARLRFARQQAGLSLSQAAKLLDTTPAELDRKEKGILFLPDSFLELAQFATVYDVSEKWLREGGAYETFILENAGWLQDAASHAGKLEDFWTLIGWGTE